jgi:hypothetical protein
MLQAIAGEDGQLLAARLAMHLGSPDKGVADAVREVLRAIKKVDGDALPKVCTALATADIIVMLSLLYPSTLKCERRGTHL